MTIPDTQTESYRRRLARYTDTLACVHCGLCLPHCPTYEVAARESDSPRGRIYLMRRHAEGDGELAPAVLSAVDRCIVCRACETACPAGVQMGELVEGFREETLPRRPPRNLKARVGTFLMRRVLPHRGRIGALTDLLWIWQVTGARRLVDAVLSRLPGCQALARLHALQPRIPPPSERRLATGTFPVPGADGAPRVRVGLFLGCIASEWFASVHRATIRVLHHCGCEVVVPEAQTCCGALHRHTGRVAESAELFRRSGDAFEAAGVDVVVVNAAGCGAALKEPPSGERPWAVPVRDICEFLDEIGIATPTAPIDATVVHSPPCHLVHGQRVDADIVDGLLRRIPGVRVVPLKDAEFCCGSGGIYNLVHPELADPLAARKATAIAAAAADIVVTGNPGCAMQIRAALDGRRVEVLHPIELLDRAYSAAPGSSSALSATRDTSPDTSTAPNS